MAEKDHVFLDTIAHLLLELHKHYNTTSFEELENRLITQAKEEHKDMTLTSQVELIALIKEVIDAYHFAAEKHKDQKRSSGEPYIIHPLYVALNEIYHQKHEKGIYEESPIIAALLHDTVEDTPTTFEEIEDKFGQRLQHIVEHLTIKPQWKSWKYEGLLGPEEKAALQFVNASKDPAAMEIKYDDRMHNLETLRHMSPEHRRNKLIETMSVGFIEHAEELKRFDFLIQLYICIRSYMTEDVIIQSDDPDHIRSMVTNALEKIQTILKDHRSELFHSMT